MSESENLSLGPTPEVFVQDVIPAAKSAALVRLSQDIYREASFLDRRVLTPGTPVGLLPWHNLVAASKTLPQAPGPDYIFHLGHVGSTLISRIIGDHPQIHALREPPWLRTLADAALTDPEAELWQGLRVLDATPILTQFSARTFRPQQRSSIKVTSFASELAPQLLAASRESRVLALVATPQIHMATLLAGENSLREVDILGPSRLIRLNRRAPGLVAQWPTLTLGEQCAATWLSEIVSLASALRIAGKAGLALDFDRFLASPRDALDAILTHFRVSVTPLELDQLASSPHFGRYSKAQSFEYSPQLRQQVLAQAWAERSNEIRTGLNWLQKVIASAPALGHLISPFWRG